jgi:phospholipid-binding lipoprotein MlaA
MLSFCRNIHIVASGGLPGPDNQNQDQGLSITPIAALLLAGSAPAAAVPLPEPSAAVAPPPASAETDAESDADPLSVPPPPPAIPEPPDASVTGAPAGGSTIPEDEPEGIVVSGSLSAPPGDPLVRLNAQSFEVTQQVDESFVAPVAMAYKDVVPGPVRTGLRNFFRNLEEPIVFLNFLLQLKPGKALETLGRFSINTAIGLGGFVDVAKEAPVSLPRRANGFADTLGYYGVKPGPFFFLPLVGPTTLRDLLGGMVDGALLPLTVGSPFNRLEYTTPTGTLRALDYRIEFDARLRNMVDESPDPYTAAREYYLRTRQAQIDSLRGITPPAVPPVEVPATEP